MFVNNNLLLKYCNIIVKLTGVKECFKQLLKRTELSYIDLKIYKISDFLLHIVYNITCYLKSSYSI